ncbi:MAG: hypothetical protein KAI64_07120, partial [Thermoplasmata archaeon]|nr:hypothetical protein [Thermoplasmata archaeon]
MRICIVTGIFPPDIGGPSSYLGWLAEALHNLGHKIRVVTYHDKKKRPDYPFPVYTIKRSKPLPSKITETLAKSIHAALKSDIIYINGLLCPAVTACLIARKPAV